MANKKYKLTIPKMWRYFKNICTHKLYVCQFCWKVGLYWQGLVHDLSKFSPVEFFNNARYFEGNRSPVDTCKEINGYSAAWLHHKGRNKHHHVYWTDYYDEGTQPIKMPYKYALEMICDWAGASKAYSKNHIVTPQNVLDWFNNKKQKGIMLHPQTSLFIEYVLKKMVEINSFKLNKKYTKQLFDKAEHDYCSTKLQKGN